MIVSKSRVSISQFGNPEGRGKSQAADVTIVGNREFDVVSSMDMNLLTPHTSGVSAGVVIGMVIGRVNTRSNSRRVFVAFFPGPLVQAFTSSQVLTHSEMFWISSST